MGAFRVAKFSKYLSEFGCNVHVLTREQDGDGDASLIGDVAGVRTLERVEPESGRVLFSKDIRWLRPIVRKALEMIDEHGIDIVFQSAPPRSPLLACVLVRHRVDIPYIVDLRDPWSLRYSMGESTLKGKAYRRLVVDTLERRVFRSASAVVLNNDRMRDMYAEKYPSLAEKMCAINNGYDPEDYEEIEPEETDGFRVVFPGKFRDDMRWFFEPFARFVGERDDVIFTHFGRRDQNKMIEARSIVEELGLEEYVTFEGYAEKSRVLSFLMGANLGLVVSKPGSKTYAGAKTYDYIGCDLPTLGVDEGVSAMRDILGDFPNAYVVERSDADAVHDALVSVYEDRPSTLGNPEAAEMYTRRSLTRELYDLMLSQVEKEAPAR
ncbi:MAG: glycosyltransferase [Halobacteriales archaeon]|nr:glycosyltransferase [Halobacteriales archaeon]